MVDIQSSFCSHHIGLVIILVIYKFEFNNEQIFVHALTLSEIRCQIKQDFFLFLNRYHNHVLSFFPSIRPCVSVRACVHRTGFDLVSIHRC